MNLGFSTYQFAVGHLQVLDTQSQFCEQLERIRSFLNDQSTFAELVVQPKAVTQTLGPLLGCKKGRDVVQRIFSPLFHENSNLIPLYSESMLTWNGSKSAGHRAMPSG